MEGTRLQNRINYWRQQQKKLTLRKSKFEIERALEGQIQQFLPTIVLSDLLQKKKYINELLLLNKWEERMK